jgi:hypothetical protein
MQHTNNKELNWIIIIIIIIIIINCPSARCASAANVVCRDFDVFKTKCCLP